MAGVLLNALASTAGGGITYLRNVLPRLAQTEGRETFFVLVPRSLEGRFKAFENDHLIIRSVSVRGGAIGRIAWEQTGLRRWIRKNDIRLSVGLGNFSMIRSPVPQILFNRNDLYFSEYFTRDLKTRKLHAEVLKHWLKSRLARISIRKADINVTPTKAFAERIREVAGLANTDFEVLHFGFDPDRFYADRQPLPADQVVKINTGINCVRLLFVSHYNYFRNFETLIRALPLISSRIADSTGKDIQLVLTTDIRRGAVYGGYDATQASDLIDSLGVRDRIAMLGSVPYERLHTLYRACDLFVCPSYSESFGHPLLEAMASGLPVLSADLPVHREICGQAALYFDVFDETRLTDACVRMITDNGLQDRLRSAGFERAREFSWDRHVKGLLQLIDRCLEGQRG